ncbi:hypothetical protein N7495_009314 [Penicillium taxi]|uniref:uncharacterized protein n=1 Tax=Penicillium taxi TaxID=168475 RepID=UPI0025456381|nr:uncharacterized protein N7495_009314 [Penicillium taxi]KAJ5884804.1 hypothetical protein N7495_009314 [Penicillium taxi]
MATSTALTATYNLGTSATSSSATSTNYPVFPNPDYVQKFFVSQNSGLTNLDIDLYNECYLPYRNLPHHSQNARRDTDLSIGQNPTIAQPTYQIDQAPCKRQAAINANCYYQNTNGKLSGLQTYSGDWDAQQKCFCEIYPFFDSATGCQECFRDHGGIEGYHWFPETYLSAVSSTYCNANPQTTGFYAVAHEYSVSNKASVPTTTASDILGTQTAASLYYTYEAERTKKSAAVHSLSLRQSLVVALPLLLMLLH